MKTPLGDDPYDMFQVGNLRIPTTSYPGMTGFRMARELFFPHLPGEGCYILSERMPASSSSSSTSCPPRCPPRLRLFHLHFRLANLANSSPSSSPTAQLSAHCWTSTCELPSSVCTAGPQPASCPAQCAPLDLNRGPAQLSVQRWTSTGDLPPDRMPEDMPDKMP